MLWVNYISYYKFTNILKMEREFGNLGSKSEFLKKRKQEREVLERKDKERKAANKIKGFFARIRDQKRFVLPFMKDSLEKLDMILEKRREYEPEKYFKMIGNALYKMPFILQTLIFITPRNLPTHQ